MKCPSCHRTNLKVIDSREAIETNAIRRRRECQDCQKRFTTFETIELSIQVHKKDGRFEDFQEQKLINGLDAACRHTKISRSQVKGLSAKITAEIMQRSERVLSTVELGEIVMNHLRELDPVAYIRFACVYRRFKDIDDVMREIKSNVKEEMNALEENRN
jgi:transcriptional repressor NrdR